MIPAYSPQARGRSERRFGTWQGRLPQELRLAGIGTVEEANTLLRERYIPAPKTETSFPRFPPRLGIRRKTKTPDSHIPTATGRV
jgi:hypothetical protein